LANRRGRALASRHRATRGLRAAGGGHHLARIGAVDTGTTRRVGYPAAAEPVHPVDTSGGPSVSIENFNIVPATLTVTAGTTVVWTNHDDVEHTVTASDNGFSSPAIQTDAQYSYTFTTPGTYSYFCAIHPFMTAKVIVQ